MSTLSFDNLSSERLGFWSPIKLKLTPSTIYYKNEKTSKTSNFESNLISSAEWIYRARGFGLCIKLSTKKRYYFDGFADKEFEKVSNYFDDNYKIKVKNVETCLKGWNWGRPKFEDEHMEFIIDGMRSFDINLRDVINANLNKNELTLQFKTCDEAFSIYEMRFATVSTNENVMKTMYSNVIKSADIAEISGDSLVSLKEIHCLQPRGRYEIKVYPQHIHLRGKTFDYSVPKENFVRFYLLPHPDERQIFFVMQINPPITHGQTRYYFIIILFNNEDDLSIDLNCSEEMLKENYNGTLTKNISGLTFEVVTKLFKSLYDQKLTMPNKFESFHKSSALTCSYKTTSGFLYPLEKGFIFVPKPSVSIRNDEIANVNLSRVSMMQRTFDFDIETTKGVVHTFSSIDKSEYNVLLKYVKSKKYVMNTDEKSGVKDNEWSTEESNDDDDGYLEKMKQEGRNKSKRSKYATVQKQGNDGDDDDDDEDDEDFKVDDVDESDVAEEYDSNASPDSSEESSEDDKSTRQKVRKRKFDEIEVEKKENHSREEAVKNTVKNKEKKKGETKKVEKKPKDPNAPKKPLTTFLLFSADIRDEVKKNLPRGSSVGDVTKAIAEKWKSISESEKARYTKIYNAEHQKYLEAMKNYEKKSHGTDNYKSNKNSDKTKSQSKLDLSKTQIKPNPKSEEFVQSSDSSD